MPKTSPAKAHHPVHPVLTHVVYITRVRLRHKALLVFGSAKNSVWLGLGEHWDVWFRSGTKPTWIGSENDSWCLELWYPGWEITRTPASAPSWHFCFLKVLEVLHHVISSICWKWCRQLCIIDTLKPCVLILQLCCQGPWLNYTFWQAGSWLLFSPHFISAWSGRTQGLWMTIHLLGHKLTKCVKDEGKFHHKIVCLP